MCSIAVHRQPDSSARERINYMKILKNVFLQLCFVFDNDDDEKPVVQRSFDNCIQIEEMNKIWKNTVVPLYYFKMRWKETTIL